MIYLRVLAGISKTILNKAVENFRNNLKQGTLRKSILLRRCHWKISLRLRKSLTIHHQFYYSNIAHHGRNTHSYYRNFKAFPKGQKVRFKVVLLK